MMKMIIDKLFDRVEHYGNVCIGLDTATDYIPEAIKAEKETVEDTLFEFNRRIIEATKDITACYKVQIAYYEAQGLKGLQAYARTVSYIRELKIPVIGDVKRGDIAKTAQMYAKAHFSGDFEVDAITVNPYLGTDTLEPYYDYLRQGKAIFVLLKTSNPGSGTVQNILSKEGKTVYETLGEKVIDEGKLHMGNNGFSSICTVVGCTHAKEGKRLRQQMPNTFFLIPGYGAQGGKAQDLTGYLMNGNGGIVNSSRGIILAYRRNNPDNLPFDEASRRAAIKMRDRINQAVRRNG